MVQSFNDLLDHQKKGIFYFLDKAQGHHLNKLRNKYGISRGRDHGVTRQNIIDNLITELIPFDEFVDWLCHIHLEGNNTLFVYEPKETKLFDDNPLDDLMTKSIEKVEQIYNLNPQTLKEIKLVNVYKPDHLNQLIFTLAAPSQLQFKKQGTNQTELRDDIYLAYIIMDYDLQNFVLMMHPTVNLASIMGEFKGKEWDELTWIILHYFKEQIINFELAEPDWLVSALFQITEEYFYHNNPIVDQKVNKLEKNVVPEILDLLKKADDIFKKEDSVLRIQRTLKNMFINELVTVHKPIKRKLAFDIFLQQSDKGVTQFKANSRGQALKYTEAGEIIRLMWENSDIVSLGIIHWKEDNGINRDYPYIISKTNQYYSLKKRNTAVTEKEVVDSVLRKLDKYKQEVRPAFDVTLSEELGYRTNDTEA
ncbi:hypothetical protein P4S83_12800 [Aneurinibacillus thermoaerophilus]|uniref:hypothetical protein n=1 Tax=Aneurinibacillus thermoaerophilus TaxID=143495 RepID=UPI002E226802|nr:hypothetical protein [Aneurinibacillus thermoaerophilus]MED0763545.1 hypothetical protein [Aneurinibacillus thermoaerophilus]